MEAERDVTERPSSSSIIERYAKILSPRHREANYCPSGPIKPFEVIRHRHVTQLSMLKGVRTRAIKVNDRIMEMTQI